MIEKDKHIKCILHGGVIVEGIVKSWSKREAVLISLSDQSTLIIPNTSRDIMLIKVVLPAEEEKAIAPQIEEEIEQVRTEPMSDLKHRRLAELRILKNKADKDIVANKLKSHSVGEVRTVQYGTPGFLSKQSSK